MERPVVMRFDRRQSDPSVTRLWSHVIVWSVRFTDFQDASSSWLLTLVQHLMSRK